jgi:hypothetical protein
MAFCFFFGDAKQCTTMGRFFREGPLILKLLQ